MQHVEILDAEHFEKNYYRAKPPKALSHLIDFYWQTRFENLWKKYPTGFSDALFPNIGYTYLVNLGTPFVMQVGRKRFNMKTDGFLPRHQHIECFHQAGNCLFGIKFKVSPIIFEKKINFSEYTEAIFPLSYLLEKHVLNGVKQAANFEERITMLNDHYLTTVKRFEGSVLPITIVSTILDDCSKNMAYNEPVENFAGRFAISTRTLQRYFEKCTSLSTKKTLQILRIRRAVEQMATDPARFDYMQYGYYDYSHFYKHLQQFLEKSVLQKIMANVRDLR